MMNFKIRMLATFALVALTLGLFSSSQSVLAVSGCQKVKGNLSAVDNGNGTAGTITQGGRLNGTVQEVFTSAITPTPDPNAFSLTNDYTVTTRRGVLKTHNVGIFDIALGVFTDFARIDPNASTGDFAGATGVLYINGRATDGGATAEITGEICFAN
jgi:uncharacterized membrane protein